MIRGYKPIVFVCILALSACKTTKTILPAETDGYHISDVDGEFIMFDPQLKEVDQSIESMISPYRAEVEGEMNEVLGILNEKMFKARPSSSLGNWLADILHEEAERLNKEKVAFALQNYGGIRIPSVEAGEITTQRVFEIMPFDNELVTLELTGEAVLKLLGKVAEYGGWPSSYGLKMDISNSKPLNIFIHGEAFDLSQKYTVALPDYIANGGDKCFFLQDFEQKKTGFMIREVMIQNLRTKKEKGQSIDGSKEERIKVL